MTTDHAEIASGPGKIVVLNKDLFFGVKIGNVLRSIGYSVEIAKTTEVFADVIRSSASDVVLGIVDINAGVDWTEIAEVTGEEGPKVPLLAFGSHLDVNGLRAAKSAGTRRVVSNGEFHRDMVKLVQRYAKSPNIDIQADEIPSEVDELVSD